MSTTSTREVRRTNDLVVAAASRHSSAAVATDANDVQSSAVKANVPS